MKPQPEEHMRGFAVGDRVICTDATDGAHFLYHGMMYLVTEVRTGTDGVTRLALWGMEKLWDSYRFRKVVSAD